MPTVVVVVGSAVTATTAAECGCCGECCGTDTTWTVTLGTVTGDSGGEIVGCDGLTGDTWVMPWDEDPATGGRAWDSGYTGDTVGCVAEGLGGQVGARLTCGGAGAAGAYILDFATSDGIVFASYVLSRSLWDCEACNEMTLSAQLDFCCDMPATVTVCPDGGMMLAGAGAAPLAGRRIALPCVHLGDAAGPKGWHVCEHDAEPLGVIVCPCKGCGPRCPGYAPAESENAPGAGANGG
jgi:hypothetical protein